MYGRAVCQDLSDGSSVFNDHFISDFYFTTIINQQNTTQHNTLSFSFHKCACP